MSVYFLSVIYADFYYAKSYIVSPVFSIIMFNGVMLSVIM